MVNQERFSDVKEVQVRGLRDLGLSGLKLPKVYPELLKKQDKAVSGKREAAFGTSQMAAEVLEVWEKATEICVLQGGRKELVN